MSARPWLAHYDPGVPATLAPYPEETLVDALLRQVRERPDAVALRFEGATTTFAALLAQARAFARALEARGVTPGERVALILPNCPQFVIAEFGAWLAGAVVAPMNPTYPEDELAGVLQRGESTVAVVLAPFYAKVKAVQSRTRVQRVIVAHIRDALAFPKSLLFRLFREAKEGHGTMPRGNDETMRALLQERRGDGPLTPRPRVHEAALLLPTGGTTGTPKLAVGTHGGLAIAGRQIDAWLSGVLEHGRDTLLVPLPLFHVYAAAGVQPLAVTAGLSMDLIPNPRDTASLLRAMRRDRPSFLCAVPGILASLTSHPDTARSLDAFRALKLCFCGAAPLLAETYRKFEQLTGGIVMEGYSLTEGMMAIVANPARGTKKIGSIGMPMPDVDVRLVDIETGTREVAAGESGEVLLAAPQLMREYWRRPGETAEALTQDAEGAVWLHTGDIGHFDDDGYLFLTDRKKELIKVSGFQVWPREVEEVLATHPAVAEVGVAAVPDLAKGERPKAWVVLRPGTSAAPDELRDYCAARLAGYKTPVAVSIVPELPKTAVGKVLRRKLRELDAAAPTVPAAPELPASAPALPTGGPSAPVAR